MEEGTMRRIDRVSDSVFGLNSSSVDSNRFYSILLDARAATVSESMYDTAEKLLTGEKDNAKIALEQLWSLKKNMISGENSGTIDMLIDYYQEKMDILRNKEEHIKKISKDSRNLLEEKRKKDEEIASVKQQISDCARELDELSAKQGKLKIKEQELSLIETQLKKELNINENEIVNGLYEIILTQREQESKFPSLNRPTAEENEKIEKQFKQPQMPEEVKEERVEKEPEFEVRTEPAPVAVSEDKQGMGNEVLDETEQVQIPEKMEADIPLIKKEEYPEVPPYPKSVVKTTRGRVIGEYYYDGKVYKNERHYIFNSKYFSEQLNGAVQFIKQRFDQTVYSELLQMIQDAFKRITENNHLHFEISTNEILNEKSLKQVWQDTKVRSFDEVERFCNRLRAKIEALGSNYRSMLQEQMDRYSKS